MDIPKCNTADIDWYVRMPTDPPLVYPTDEMQPELCEEAGAIWELIFPQRDSFHIEMGRLVCWNKSNTIFVDHFKNMAG